MNEEKKDETVNHILSSTDLSTPDSSGPVRQPAELLPASGLTGDP